MSSRDAAAREAHEALGRALLRLSEDGRRVVCTDDQRWISDEPHERAQAVSRCVGCPVLRECAAAGEHASFGVWGGIDRSPATSKRRKTA